MLSSSIDYCWRVWQTSGPMCGPRWCIWSPNTWSGPTLTSSPSCWSTEYQRLLLKQSCWSPSTPHLLCSTHVNWQRRLYRHHNPDSSHPLVPDGGMTFRCLSEEGQSPLLSKSYWRHNCSESTCSPNNTFSLHPSSLSLYSSALVVGSLGLWAYILFTFASVA